MRGNPGAEVSGLLNKGFKVWMLIVGVGLHHEAAERELWQIGDQFIHAKDGKALRRAIEQVLAVPYDVLGAAGKPLTIADVRVAHDQLTRVELKKEGQEGGVSRTRPDPTV